MRHWLIYLNILIPSLLLLMFREHRTWDVVSATIVAPGLLLFLNAVFLFARLESSVLRSCAFMLGGLFLPLLIGYGYSAARARTWVPVDAEALWITQALGKYYIGWVVVLFVIFHVGRLVISFLSQHKT